MTKPELNPNDAIYVSKKNFQRKQNVVNGLSNNLSNIVDGRPGPITTLVLYLADTFISLCLRFFYNIIKICTFSFDWVNNMLFGNFKGILPTSTTTKGKVISLKFFRYIMTVLIPPFGILLNKGLLKICRPAAAISLVCLAVLKKSPPLNLAMAPHLLSANLLRIFRLKQKPGMVTASLTIFQ